MSARPPPPVRADLPGGAWMREATIRFSHCDPAGIVYYARWFDLLNGVIEDWFGEALGLGYHAFIRDRRIGLGYASAHADYLRPGMMGDIISFAVFVERIGGASLGLAIPGWRGEEAVLSSRLTIVTTDLAVHRAMRLPEDLRAALETYQERCR